MWLYFAARAKQDGEKARQGNQERELVTYDDDDPFAWSQINLKPFMAFYDIYSILFCVIEF